MKKLIFVIDDEKDIKWHDVFVVDRTIDVHIMNLHTKPGDYKNITTAFSGAKYGIEE